jgi:hypothetical protein
MPQVQKNLYTRHTFYAMSDQAKQQCPYEAAVEKFFGPVEYSKLSPERLHELVGLLCMFDEDKKRHKDAVEYLMYQVAEMREYQRQYAAHGMSHAKQQAGVIEKKVDATLLKYKGRKYDGSRFKDNTTQSTLFK